MCGVVEYLGVAVEGEVLIWCGVLFVWSCVVSFRVVFVWRCVEVEMCVIGWRGERVWRAVEYLSAADLDSFRVWPSCGVLALGVGLCRSASPVGGALHRGCCVDGLSVGLR